MPKFRNLFNYSAENRVHRPRETLVDVPVNDSVEVITINFERSGVVQIRRRDVNDLIQSSDGSPDWEVATNFEVKPIKVSTPNGR